MLNSVVYSIWLILQVRYHFRRKKSYENQNKYLPNIMKTMKLSVWKASENSDKNYTPDVNNPQAHLSEGNSMDMNRRKRQTRPTTFYSNSNFNSITLTKFIGTKSNSQNGIRLSSISCLDVICSIPGKNVPYKTVTDSN